MDVQAVKKAYKRLSPLYNIVFNACFHPGRRASVDILNSILPDHAKVLEVGVGTGLSIPMYKQNLRITGIDVSSEMLKKAKQLVNKNNLEDRVDIHEMDAEDLTFSDQSFDAVVAMYVVSVVPNLQKFFDEILRVCKDGGDIIIVNHFSSSKPIIRAFEKAITKVSKYVGFHSDFPIEPVKAQKQLRLVNQRKINMFGYWTLLHFKKESVSVDADPISQDKLTA